MWVGWVHHSWIFEHAKALREVGPKMPERGSKTSTVPVVWATFGFFFGAIQIISCRARLVTMDETWLYHYDPETMECQHSGSPRPKKFRVQKSAGKVLASIFWDEEASSPLIIFQRAKLSTRSITYLSWCNWRTFEGKTAGGSPMGSYSCTTMPRLTGHLKPRRNWPTWASNVLSHPYSPDLAQSAYHLFPGLKKQLKGRHFSSDAEVVAAAETWMDGQSSDVFWVACKS